MSKGTFGDPGWWLLMIQTRGGGQDQILEGRTVGGICFGIKNDFVIFLSVCSLWGGKRIKTHSYVSGTIGKMFTSMEG